MPTSNKIAAFIGIALGGAQGGTNQALQAFQRNIDRDISSQERDIDIKKIGAQIQVNLIGSMRAQFNNRRAAQSATKALLIEKFKIDLASTAAKFKSPLIQAKALDTIGKLNVLKEQEIVKFQTAVGKQAQDAGGTKFGRAGNFNPSKLTEDERKSLIPGVGIAASPDHRKTFVKQTEGLRPAMKEVNKLLELGKSGSRFSLKDRAKARTTLIALVGKLRIPFTGPGVLQQKEFERLLDALGDPTKIIALPSIEIEKLKTVLEILRQNLDVAKEDAGIETPAGVLSFQPTQ